MLVDRPARAGDWSSSTWQTHWVPSTIFFFESESTLKELVLQRRRWLNGTLAGYLWLMRQPQLWSGVCRLRGTAWAVLLLSSMQLFVFLVVYLWPGMLILTGYLALSGLCLVGTLLGVPYSTATAVLCYAYVIVALLSFLQHITTARFGETSFNSRSWAFRVAFNAVTVAMVALSAMIFLVLSFADPGRLAASIVEGGASAADAARDVAHGRFAAVLGFLYTFSPFLLATMHSPDSFKCMVECFPRYYCFQPTILADFFSYAISRCDDLSWGTKSVAGQARSLAGGLAETAAARRTARARSADDRRDGAGGSRRADLLSKMRAADAREASNGFATAVSVSQALACLVIAGANLALRSPSVLFYLGLGLSAVGFCILAMSFAFFLGTALCATRGTLASRATSVAVFAGWVVLCGSAGLVALRSDGVGAVVFFVTAAALAALAFGRLAANAR